MTSITDVPIEMDANRSALARDARAERLASAGFVLPCLVVVTVCVILPCAWLFWLSLFGTSGRPSLENYARLTASASYTRIFITTFEISFATVVACVVIGVPFATFINQLSARRQTWFVAAILLPFWTSLLVRAYAWLVLLQRNGLVNSWLLSTGIISEPLPLAFNAFATVLGMVHIMLPIFLLPVLGAMRSLDPAILRAAASLGASRSYAFRRVFLPMAAPGIIAGSILVFVMSLGFYVTPAILGGGNVNVVSMRIAKSLSNYSNWGAASALGVVLLLFTGLMFWASYALQARLRGSRRGGAHA